MKRLQLLLMIFLAIGSLHVSAQNMSSTPPEDGGAASRAERAALKKRIRAGRELATQEGTMLVGLNALYANVGVKGDGTSLYDFGISPRAGFFVEDNLAIGLTLNIDRAVTRPFRSESYGAGAFARYYFGMGLNRKGRMQKYRTFLEGGSVFSAGTATFTNSDLTEEKQGFRSINPYLMPGFNYFLNRQLVLDGGLYLSGIFYGHNSSKDMPGCNRTGLNAGVHYFLDW